MSDYPLGAKYDKNAPYNEVPNEPVKVRVLISLTLSKTVEIEVDDYTIFNNKINFSDCDLESAVCEQVMLPQEIGSILVGNPHISDKIIEDLKDWNVDEIVTMLDE